MPQAGPRMFSPRLLAWRGGLPHLDDFTTESSLQIAHGCCKVTADMLGSTPEWVSV